MRYILFLLALSLAACNPGPTAQAQQPVDQPTIDKQTPAGNLSSVYTSYFDGDEAWKHLHNQVALGPRVPGTPGHTACRHYLQRELLAVCDTVEEQEFEVQLPVGKTKMYNIIARFNLEAERRIILGAHWDTRPTADHNPPGSRNQPIPGANDGASGVAVLLELARVFSENPPPVGVDIVLFDGEDYGPSLTMMFFGSKHFAKNLRLTQIRSYNYGILLDMVGDADLEIHPELNSEATASAVYIAAYEVSRALGYDEFKIGGGISVTDDHVFLLEKGVKMYDFIDFDYPYWHRTDDTEDKCRPESLEIVGRTVENMIYLFPNLYAPDA